MDETRILKDGTEVRIEPLTPQDLGRLVRFFQALPPEDRRYLRIDVTRKDLVERRLRRMADGEDRRIIAVREGEIVGLGVLELSGEGWLEHHGELRVIVARALQRKGLGTILMRELYHIAAGERVKVVVVQMMRPQVAAQRICKKLGFKKQRVMPGHVRDGAGESQDLVTMTCDLDALWKVIERSTVDADWRRCR